MAFGDSKFETQSEKSKDELLAELADLKKRREDLMLHVGTDAWVPADRDLLARLDEQIKELEREILDKEASKSPILPTRRI